MATDAAPRPVAKRRVNDIALGRFERWALPRMAAALPRWVTPDTLTGLGLVAALGIGAAYAAAGQGLGWLHVASALLVLHWWADSLDGTLARVRGTQRERYGFYVDHQSDALAVLFICVGLGLSPLMRLPIALGLLIAIYLMMLLVGFVTIARDVFKISFNGIGPTEGRLLIVGANTLVWALGNPTFVVRGFTLTLFDALALAGTAGLLVAYAATSLIEKRKLEAIEPPHRPQPAAADPRPVAPVDTGH